MFSFRVQNGLDSSADTVGPANGLQPHAHDQGATLYSGDTLIDLCSGQSEPTGVSIPPVPRRFPLQVCINLRLTQPLGQHWIDAYKRVQILRKDGEAILWRRQGAPRLPL